MKKQYLAVILTVITILVLSPVAYILLSNMPAESSEPLRYTYEIVNAYPHDTDAFTEGLVFEDGFIYEGTGLNGASTLRKVELKTGRTLQFSSLPSEFFGEGITILGDRIIQLTWQSQKGFVYNKSSFDILEEFTYPTEGWGITYDGIRLIMSDGTANLYFLKPETFEVTGQVEVHDKNGTVANLNELEYVKGYVYANIWTEDRIAIIDSQTGEVKGWIDLTGLRSPTDADPDNVLNGIAYDASVDRLFVTGKRWATLYKIKVVPQE
jgi:glutamine cyclotransferase